VPRVARRGSQHAHAPVYIGTACARRRTRPESRRDLMGKVLQSERLRRVEGAERVSTPAAAPAQSRRLERGGLIDRSKPLSFTFDGRTMTGFAGDTLGSALIANGVRIVGRSFKYHRPRGILTAGSEEPNALVELREGARQEPNTRATTIELYGG